MDYERSAVEEALGRPMTEGEEDMIERAGQLGELSAPRESLISRNISVLVNKAINSIILIDRQKEKVIQHNTNQGDIIDG